MVPDDRQEFVVSRPATLKSAQAERPPLAPRIHSNPEVNACALLWVASRHSIIEMEFVMTIKVGSPYLWKSGIYGDTAVHVESVYNGVAMVTVDGGAASRQVREHPELAEAWPVITERLVKRPSKARKAAGSFGMVPGLPPERVLAEKAGIVKNTIREVPGVGKVAIITDDRPTTTAQRAKRRLGLAAALNVAREMADRNPTHFKWAPLGEKHITEVEHAVINAEHTRRQKSSSEITF